MDKATSMKPRMKHFVRINHYNDLTRIFASYFKSKLFCDVTICCGGRNFEAHKLVLSIYSSYLKTIFQQDSATHPIVYVPDVTPEAAKLVIKYCYEGEITLPKNKLQMFSNACKILQIKDFSGEKVYKLMAYNISVTDKESNTNIYSANLHENNRKTEARIELLNDSSITFIEDSNEQEMEDIRQSPPSSHVLVDNMSPSSISSIRRNNTKNSPQNQINSPPSSPESLVFDWKTNQPKNTRTRNESVVFKTQPNEVIELSSEELDDQIKEPQPGTSKINQDNVCSFEDTPQIEQSALNSIISDDSDDSVIMSNKRTKKRIRSPSKRLKVAVPRIELIETQEGRYDSLAEQKGSEENSPQFLESDYSTHVMDIKHVPKYKLEFYCELCRRCIKPFSMKRHHMKHALYY